MFVDTITKSLWQNSTDSKGQQKAMNMDTAVVAWLIYTTQRWMMMDTVMNTVQTNKNNQMKGQ